MTALWAKVGETVDFKIVRGEVAKLERWGAGMFLDRTDEKRPCHRGNSSQGRVCSVVSEAHQRQAVAA